MEIQKPEIASPFRYKIFFIGLLIAFGILIGRLFQLQFLQGQHFQDISIAQAIRASTITPPRGMICDRNAVPIVLNELAFTIAVYPALFPDSLLPTVATLTKLPIDPLRKKIRYYRKIAPYSPIKILYDAPYQLVSFFEEHAEHFPGLTILEEMKRSYPLREKLHASHIVGYIREINQSQLQQFAEGTYQEGDFIGYEGIEREYENFLRGEKGVEYLAVNALGQTIAHFNDRKNDIPPRQGFDILLTIDLRLQAVAESLLTNRQGALVAMDPRTGEILALASAPDFDPALLSGRIDPDVYQSLIHDSSRPLLNRTTYGLYPPGSVWKLLIALAALQEGSIRPEFTIFCGGGYQFGNRFFKCHGAHGTVNLQRAIQVSCNTYFYRLGLLLGANRIAHYAKLFGFAQKTGIDIPEAQGFVPDSQWYNKRYKNWTQALLLNLGIGQGEILVTPLQVAAYTAALANRGLWVQPHLVSALKDRGTGKLIPIAYGTRRIPIHSQWFSAVLQGMYDVVQTPGGTALNAAIPGVKIYGKTGTAQNPHGKDHSWFSCFAAQGEPEIVVTVIVENAGFGSTVAVPIARAFLQAYFQKIKKSIPIEASPPSSDTLLSYR